MLIDVLLAALGLVLLVAGAEGLVRGGSALARRLGLTPLVVGLTVVAMGTSAPEMVVSVTAALRGHGDVAVGNVVGSNIFNVGVILALTALISPLNIRLGVLKVDAPLMVAVSMVGAGFAGLEIMPRWAGLLLVVLLIGYMAFSIRVARRQATEEVSSEFDEGVPDRLKNPAIEVLVLAIGLTLLVLGSGYFIRSASAIARALEVSEAVISLTIVAAGTSMPELATSAVAAFRGQADIAVGNIIGSNIFNIAGILGVAACLRPLSAPGIHALDLWVMLAFSVGLLPLLWSGRKLQRWEGALLLAGYIAYLWKIWPHSG